jgi:hypothetical protein
VPGRISRRTYIRLTIAFVAAAVVLASVLYVLDGGHRPSDASPVTSSLVTSAPSEPLLAGAPVLVSPAQPSPATVPSYGFDVSHPQCGSALPAGGGYGIVGISKGKALTANPCLKVQLTWANDKPGHAVYLNTGYPGTTDPVSYGRAAVDDAISAEHAVGHGTSVWWLDVETTNTWVGTQQENATVLDAMVARLQGLGVRVGIYSTPAMWEEIAGSWEPGLPIWYATGPATPAEAVLDCTNGFAGSTSAIVQWTQRDAHLHRDIDRNVICPQWRHRAAELLDLG